MIMISKTKIDKDKDSVRVEDKDSVRVKDKDKDNVTVTTWV